MGSWLAALNDINHCITVDATRADVFILRAKLHWRLNEPKKGNADFKKAHAIDPDHPEVLIFERHLWEQAEGGDEMAGRAAVLELVLGAG
jgi:hypothetical protein